MDSWKDIDDVELIEQTRLLLRINLSEHNAAYKPPLFSSLECHAPSQKQCESPEFLHWANLITRGDSEVGPDLPCRWGGTFPNFSYRKLWEWAQILEVAKIADVLGPNKSALGFAVGQEPIPAILAKYGVKVLASDAPTEKSKAWIPSGEHMNDLSDLLHPEIVPDEIASKNISILPIDMNYIPENLGTFDFIWSSCAMEHLGTPELGLEFLVNTLNLLNPGGVSCHTTEIELEPREITADYGHCAVYQLKDINSFASRVRDLGYEISLNTSIAMDTAEDRWISRLALVGSENTTDLAHLKLGIGESISTSFAIVVRKPFNGNSVRQDEVKI
jgi:hypothetical protein